MHSRAQHNENFESQRQHLLSLGHNLSSRLEPSANAIVDEGSKFESYGLSDSFLKSMGLELPLTKELHVSNVRKMLFKLV